MQVPFQPGDVVVCVDASPRGLDPRTAAACARLTVRRIYRVTDVCYRFSEQSARFDGLYNADIWPLWADWWRCGHFRKIDAADEQFTTQIRACKPQPAKRERV